MSYNDIYSQTAYSFMLYISKHLKGGIVCLDLADFVFLLQYFNYM